MPIGTKAEILVLCYFIISIIVLVYSLILPKLYVEYFENDKRKYEIMVFGVLVIIWQLFKLNIQTSWMPNYSKMPILLVTLLLMLPFGIILKKYLQKKESSFYKVYFIILNLSILLFLF